MPYIDSKVSISISNEQEVELKKRLGEAIEIIPGKSEGWLMIGFQDNYHLYFRGDNNEPTAYVEIKVFGKENPSAFNSLTREITNIFKEVLNISPDHLYIKYEAVSNWGWNGENF